jgi:DNA modification methylase
MTEHALLKPKTKPKGLTTPWRNRIVGSGEVDPAQLVVNPLNWRVHPAAQRRALTGSLDEIGWVQQILVNRATARVVDGHARIDEAISRHEALVPVLYVDLDPDEEALVLASLDPIGAMATADKEKLEELLRVLTPNDAGLQAVLDDLADTNSIHRLGLIEPDDLPAPPDEEEIYVKAGDLWQLGQHRLLCGDSTEPGDVARLMAGEEAECLWTDPPYGIEYVGKTAEQLTIQNDGAEGSDTVVIGAFRAAQLAPSARFYIAAPAGPRHVTFHEAVLSVGWRLHQELVWAKGSIVLGHSDYHYAHEPILYGYLPGSGRPGRGRHEGTKWYGDHAQSSVLEYPRPTASVDHPTMKPVGLVSQCLANSTTRGDLIYDGFLGSGTTLIAAEQLGRRCFGLEIEPRYAQVTIQRWEAFTGKKAERIDD